MDQDKGKRLILLTVATLPFLASIACASQGQGGEGTTTTSTPDALRGTVDAQGTQSAEQATLLAQTLQALSAALTPAFTETSTSAPVPSATATPDFLTQISETIRTGITCEGGVNVGTLAQSADGSGNRQLGVELAATTNEGSCIVELTQVLNELTQAGVSRERFGLAVTNPNNQASVFLTVYDPSRLISHQSGTGFNAQGFYGGSGVQPYMTLGYAEEERNDISDGWDNGASWTVRVDIQELDNGEKIMVFVIELPAQE